MAVRIYGVIQFECTQRVVLVCKELNIPYELIVVNIAQHEHKSPKYIAEMQPFGQVPVLEDEDGFRIFESRAICRYLAEKYGQGELLPHGFHEIGLFEQALSIEQNNFNPSAHSVAFERYMKKSMHLTTDEDRARESLKTLEAKLEGYELILSKQKYLAGDKVTLADLYHLTLGTYLCEKVGVDVFSASPNVSRWWTEISSRPSWKAVQADAQAAGPFVLPAGW